uniref:NADH-ubiquinone oxidoreductase chain 2 n=1 Tax=Allonychiurus kimi TaxID=2779777 RepID=A0A7M3UYT5_9HEXA|nr:NADH dehydrogenase subunit 2 [Allonychiurus kimi]QOL12112.1 NADH dehydrogenase subunit 2 [Allonychiurus kimi]
MLNSLKFNLYLLCLMFGTFLTISSSSWISCWLGLEINLMSLIPILLIKINPHSSESSIKYFIAQSLASILIIFSTISNFFFNSSNSMIFFTLLIIVALSIKMGAAPFHFWLPQVIQTSNWTQMIIILTWQKIAPMILLMFSMNNLIKLIILASCFIGVLGAINQTLLKKILVYSSILHTGWLLSSIFCSVNIWFFYFSIYSIISLSLLVPLNFTNIYLSKNLFSSFLPPFFLIILFINLLSLAGIPPFLGFFMKLSTIINLISLNFDYFLLITLIFSSLISLFYYLRIMYSSMIMTSKINKLNNLIFFNHPIHSTSLILSFLANLIFPMLFMWN